MSEHLGFQYLSREQLLERARTLGVRRPELLTKAELEDEIQRLSSPETRAVRPERGWLGTARTLLANVVDSSLNLKEAARVIRGAEESGPPRTDPPVRTITLAEIYASQGHVDRALAMLDKILREEPDHERARVLRERLLRPKNEERSAAPVSAKAPSAFRAETEVTQPLVVDTVAEAVDTSPLPPAVEVAQAVAGEHFVEAPPAVDRVALVVIEDPPVAVDEPPAAPVPGAAKPITSDSLTLIRKSEGEVWLYWELATPSAQAREARFPNSQTIVRLAIVHPTWDGAKKETLDLEVGASSGALDARVPPPPALVRASLGVRCDAAFVPLAVARELLPDGDSAATIAWAPPGRHDSDLSSAEERALGAFRDRDKA